jgi:DNA-directed RNA polymerase III subunit RPC1
LSEKPRKRYLITDKSRFFSRSEFVQLLSSVAGVTEDLPAPAIWKPSRLWTGKQVFSSMLRAASGPVGVDMEVRNKGFSGPVDKFSCLDPSDNFVVVQNSELLCGRIDKKIIGTGSKENLVHVLLCRRGPKVVFCSVGFLCCPTQSL